MVKRLLRLLIVITVLISVWGLVSPAQAQGANRLEQMLGQVTSNPESRTVIWYGALSDLRNILGIQIKSLDDFNKLSRQQQAAYLLDIGNQVYYSAFSGMEDVARWKKAFGIDPFAIDRELTVGTSPNWYAILQGNFPASSIAQALQKSGYKPVSGSNPPVYSTTSSVIDQNFYNFLVVTNNQIIAAPSSGLIQTAASPNNPIIRDAAYLALVRTLEGASTVPNTQLLSAALFGGTFLSDRLITAEVESALGKTMPDLPEGQPALQQQLLPRYQVAGVGYRRDAKDRYWVIALVYPNADDAKQADAILPGKLTNYVSQKQAGRKLFTGWKVDSKVIALNNFQVVTAVMQLPEQTDVSWTELITQRDLGFLATER